MSDVEGLRLRLVVADAKPGERLGVPGGEIPLLQIQRVLEGAEELAAELQLAIEIGAERPAEVGRLRRPVVGAVEANAAHMVGIVRRQVMRHLDGLRDIAGAFEAVVGRNPARRHIAPVIGPVEVMVAHLLRDREREEPLHGSLRPRDHRLRELMVDDIEEAGARAGCVDRPRHGLALGPARRIERTEVDDRHLGGRGAPHCRRVHALPDLKRCSCGHRGSPVAPHFWHDSASRLIMTASL